MASKVGICNSAMRKLGAARIDAFTEDSKEAELCRDAYDQIRRRLLRANPWNFALMRKDLAETGTDPLNEWSHSYQLPTDSLKVVQMVPVDYPYVIEGRLLLCNCSSVAIKYVKDAQDVNEFDPAFAEVLAYEIAIDLCTSLTDSETKKQSLLAEYGQYRGEAQTEDAQENMGNNYLSDDVFLNARSS